MITNLPDRSRKNISNTQKIQKIANVQKLILIPFKLFKEFKIFYTTDVYLRTTTEQMWCLGFLEYMPRLMPRLSLGSLGHWIGTLWLIISKFKLCSCRYNSKYQIQADGSPNFSVWQYYINLGKMG